MINFKDMVVNLAKPGAEIIKDLTPESAHLLHMAVGVSGEVGELIEGITQDKGIDNIIEELGDIEFYLEGLTSTLNIKVGITANDYVEDIASLMLTLTIMSGGILDEVKKSSIYAKELNVDSITDHIRGFKFTMDMIYKRLNMTRNLAIEGNIKKLGKRYSSGSYDNKQAQDRADKV